jgi:hypothetical protein
MKKESGRRGKSREEMGREGKVKQESIAWGPYVGNRIMVNFIIFSHIYTKYCSLTAGLKNM